MFFSESKDNFVIILGDYNTTQSAIDVFDEEEWSYANSYSRKWFNEFLELNGDISLGGSLFYDSFRHLNPDVKNSFTCWNVMLGCRTTNFGSRLDYIVIDQKLLPYLHKCYPLTEYIGSDHCPVVAEFDNRIRFVISNNYSKNSTKLWPEFGRGTSQSSIKNFFLSANRSEMIATMQSKFSPTKKSMASPQKSFKDKRKKNLQLHVSKNSVKYYFQSLKPKIVENEKIENDSEIQPTSVESSPEDLIVVFDNSNNVSFSDYSTQSVSQQWKALFRQEPPPLCSGHKLPCIKRKVKKAGPQQGREFYACPKSSVGPSDHPESRCNYFQWVSVMKCTSPKKG